MKKHFSRVAALLIATLLLMSSTGCFSTAALIYRARNGRDARETQETRDDGFFDDDVFDDDSWHKKATPTPKDDKDRQTDPSDPTEPTEQNGGKGDGQGILTDPNNGLTYPDGIASQDEIHPKHEKGNVSGQAAKQLLADIEKRILNEAVASYVDAELCFDDYAKYGIEPEGYGWGDYSTDTDATVDKEILEQLYTIDPDSLDDSDRIFYDKVVYDLEEGIYMSQFTAFPYYEMEFNPLVGPQNEVLFILEIFDFETKEDAEHYLEVLKDLDRYYDQICDFEKERADYGYASSPEIYEESAKSFDALVEQTDDCFLYDSFRERLSHINGLSDADRNDLISRHDKIMKEVVFPEFEECAGKMRDLKSYNGKDAGLSQFPGGREYYECTFRSQTNSSKTIAEATADLDKVIDNLKDTNSRLMSNYMDWYFDYAMHNFDKGSVKENLDFLENAVSADFPGVPEHSYKLMDVPKVFEDSFSPAAFLSYHQDKFDSNIIIVNKGGIHGDLGVTIAHEGYPGHMLQSLYTRAHTDHPYLYLFDSIGYAEGWAQYCENYAMKYYSDNSDLVTYCQVTNEADCLITARCDIGIHCEGWNIEDCVRLFSKLGMSVSSSSFREYYNLLQSDPNYSTKYGCGFVNTGIIMSKMKNEFPAASDKDIHTAYLNSLTGTFEQIEDHMRKELTGKFG